MKTRSLLFAAMIALTLAVVTPAKADVFFFGLQNISVAPGDFTGVFVDITTGVVAVPTDPPLNWDINVTLAGGIVYSSPNLEMVRTAGGNTDATNRILALGAGATVDGSQLYDPVGYGASDGHTGAGAGFFNTGTPAYMGFRYLGSQYGWMQAVLNPNTSAGTLMNWAYETNGASMTAGNITQDLVGSVSTVTMTGLVAESHTLASVIANGGSFTTNVVKNGAGTWTLGAANTYTGGTTVNLGTLALGASNRLADTGAVNVNGGTLAMSTFNDTVGAVTLTSGSITGTGTLTGASYGVLSGTISANLAGSGAAMSKTTAGTVVLTGANTFTGATTISGGTLTAGAANALGGTSGITINGGGTLALSDNTTSNHLNDSATITLAGGKIQLNGVGEGTHAAAGAGMLSLTSNSVIDLASTSLIHFLASNTLAGTWAGNALSIWNWNGIPLTGGGLEQILFGTDSTALTVAQLAAITFYSDSGLTSLGTATWATNGGGEIVPLSEVPEPRTWFVGALVAATLLAAQRRRLFVRRVPALAAA